MLFEFLVAVCLLSICCVLRDKRLHLAPLIITDAAYSGRRRHRTPLILCFQFCSFCCIFASCFHFCLHIVLLASCLFWSSHLILAFRVRPSLCAVGPHRHCLHTDRNTFFPDCGFLCWSFAPPFGPFRGTSVSPAAVKFSGCLAGCTPSYRLAIPKSA